LINLESLAFQWSCLISLQGICLFARLLRQGAQRCFLGHTCAACGLFSRIITLNMSTARQISVFQVLEFCISPRKRAENGDSHLFAFNSNTILAEG